MRDGRLWVNGRMLPLRRDGIGAIEADDGALQPAPRFVETLPNGREHPIFKYRPNGELDDTQQFFVGEGQIFVMGDNRDDSADSRFWGFAPVDNVVGNALFIYWSWYNPPSRNELQNNPMPDGYDPEETQNFHIRWSRLFRGAN